MSNISQYLNPCFIILFTLYLYYKFLRRGRKPCEPTNFPVIGMIPAVIQNVNRAHDYLTEVLSQCGGTYEFKGPWFCNMDMVFTSDPANIHHVFSRNFSNYPKGPEFRKIFEVLGDGIFNTDFELWEFHRSTIRSLLNHGEFNELLEKTVWGKIEHGLIPVLDHLSEKNGGDQFDLQDVLERFSFDTTCQLVLDHDPKSLSLDMPRIPCERAFGDLARSLLYRHVIPETIWRLMNYFRIGTEKRVSESWRDLDEFVYPKLKEVGEQDDKDLSFMSAFEKGYLRDERVNSTLELNKFLRDSLLNLIFAGRGTTTGLTWLFWLICNNPESKVKILDEMRAKLGLEEGDKWRFFTAKESSKLTYLHGALQESLRLFPPVALEHKSPIKSDFLPSGHFLAADSKLIFSLYSVGRMESVWGKDCLEFRPERWISAKGGGLLHEPSFKFPAFNAGPRSCLGKDMAIVQTKMLASMILYHYEVELVEGHEVSTKDSIILQAKHGLNVRLFKRKPFVI